MARNQDALGNDPLSWIQEPDVDIGQHSLPAEGNTEILHFLLPEELTIATAGQLKDGLDARLDDPELLIDAASVTVVDTAGVQLLISFKKNRDQLGFTTAWQASVPPVLADVVSLLGLEEVSGLTESDHAP